MKLTSLLNLGLLALFSTTLTEARPAGTRLSRPFRLAVRGAFVMGLEHIESPGVYWRRIKDSRDVRTKNSPKLLTASHHP